ncbi:MAG TPA: hypothetical protein VMV10_24665 [Pirellulales bacterium]|nr:hypothetical protein [Pirellulales bacterium]
MILAEMVLGAHDWLWRAVPLAIVALAVLAWSYSRGGASGWVRIAAGLLKATAVAALAACLVEPLFSGTRPRPQSNLFLIAADNSRSLEIHDRGQRRTRGEELQARLDEQTPWLVRLAQDFDVRRYAFDARLAPVKDFATLDFAGDSTALTTALASLAERFEGRPIAGVLLFTDGNATDAAALWAAESGKAPLLLDAKRLPPVYPVVAGTDDELPDVSVARVTVTQTNFESAPVTLTAEIQCQGVGGRKLSLRVLDEARKLVEQRTAESPAEGQVLVERFQLRPEKPGVSFYSVRAGLAGEEKFDERPGKSSEATLVNNRRLATVDRGGGPYRVLYVSGRPNWEFKFLRRALQEDDEVNLVGLVRIAKKEPKFTFRGRSGESTNPLYRGFGNQGDEEAEQYDEPVLLRLGTEDKDELKGGFPKGAAELFKYHALVLDDVEAAFFTHEQMSLVQQFVSQRGGGFLMLGGQRSFADGGYHRTPIGELLPAYLERGQASHDGAAYKLLLTREGWLQPWVRMRTTEPEELQRLSEMPPFETLSPLRSIKPGATVLAEVQAAGGAVRPALVVQPFGRGRAAALAIGDLWRWNLLRKKSDDKEVADSDLEKAWRQTVRWLVADVPQRVEIETARGGDPASPVEITVRVRDEMFEPLDNASVAVRVETPEGKHIELAAEPSDRAAGEYRTSFASRAPGAYRAQVAAKAEDASEIDSREAGWTVETATDELRTLRPNRALLERIAEATGGETVAADRLEEFVASLPNRKIPVVEAWTYPLWHQGSVFLLAVGCLIGEWGLRRWKGLP